MGQKIHPVGLRLGITRTWDSRWFEKKNYVAWLHEDVAIRKYFGRMTRAAAISRVEIERRANQARVIINTGKPGIIIGKRGVGIDEIRRNLETLTGKQVQVNVVEIKTIELDARLTIVPGHSIIHRPPEPVRAFAGAIHCDVLVARRRRQHGARRLVARVLLHYAHKIHERTVPELRREVREPILDAILRVRQVHDRQITLLERANARPEELRLRP